MDTVSAAIIIIGNEILSGRTKDRNAQVIITELAAIGIKVEEVRIIPDQETAIINTIREIYNRYTYIFTTGGIGPTHDDITSESIAKAFSLPWVRSEEIYNILQQLSKKQLSKTASGTMNPAQEKMAYIPEGSRLIYCEATRVPGFAIENIFALAGVPVIMESMLKAIIPTLKHGRIIKSKTVTIMVAESRIAEAFAALQSKYPEVDMGSYPFNKNNKYGTALVLRSCNYIDLEKSYKKLKEILKSELI